VGISNSLASPESESHRDGHINAVGVRCALDQILASRPFRNSHQCSTLLRYIVDHTLAGEENLLRERVIGCEVFGRPPGYEPGEDPVVRLRAAEVRKRLAQYYQSDPDPAGVQIEVPPGSYRAVFHARTEPPSSHREAEEQTSFATELSTIPASGQIASPAHFESSDQSEGQRTGVVTLEPRPSRPRALAIVIAVGVLVLLAAVAVLLVRAADQPEKKSFRAFWEPWISSQKPVIISIGSNAVYRFQDAYIHRYAQEHGLETSGQEIFIPFKQDDMLPGRELYPAYNSFVALGDVAAVSNIVASLAKQGKTFQERFPNDVSFAELRNTASVLVGGFNNPMTMELTKHLEFVMRGGNEIDDTLNPNRKWLLHASVDSRDTEDYAILTRLIQRNEDAPLMSVAGLGQYGTLAAAELICSPADLYQMTRQFGKGWAGKNLQVVLRVRVVDFKPAPPEIVAYRIW